jgi:cell division septation protein DedD
VRQAVVAAVSAAPSLPDACDTLRQRAPSLARFGLLALAHLLLLAGLAAVGLSGARGSATRTPVSQVSEPALPPAPVPLPAPPAPAPAAALPLPDPAPVVAMAVSAPTPEARPETPPPSPAPAPMPAPTPAPLPAPTPLPPKPAVAEPKKARPEAEAKPPPAREGGWGVNVGLFADPANAERVAARLKAAGLPVRQDTLEMPRGERVRVRVGPLPGRAQARQAAERIRALGLEAQVFRQGASD